MATLAPHPLPKASPDDGTVLRSFLGTFRFAGRGLKLVWGTSRSLTVWLAVLTLAAGLVPGGIAYVGKLLVDTVIRAARTGAVADKHLALTWVAVEGGLVVVLLACQRGLTVARSLLRARLGHQVNVQILEKALRMSLPQFEDSGFYDRLTRARREASTRPLSLVNRTFSLGQNAVSLVTYAGLLLSFSPWAVGVLGLCGLPAFVAEAKFSGEAFRLFKWRSPETREQMYLEVLLAREDYAKEVQLFGLGPLFLDRYRAIFDRIYGADRDLTLRRNLWGWVLGLVGILALYGAYAWTVVAAVAGAITLGAMTMYLAVFRQGQGAFTSGLDAIAGMYEDNLYLSTLYELLDEPTPAAGGTATEGPAPADGVRFEDVSFTYPGGLGAGAPAA